MKMSSLIMLGAVGFAAYWAYSNGYLAVFNICPTGTIKSAAGQCVTPGLAGLQSPVNWRQWAA